MTIENADSNIRSWVVPASAEQYARERVERVNKRIRRHGLTPYVLTVEPAPPVPEFEKSGATGWTVIDGIDWPVIDGKPCPVLWHEQVKITLTGEPPRYAGWDFIATIEADAFAGTLTRVVPGVEVNLDALRARDASECDHCNVDRDRHSVYAVRHAETGEIKQVGSTCLTAFLGVHVSLSDVDAVLSTGTLEDDLGGLGGGGWADIDRSVSPVDVLAIAVYLVARHGWLSKSNASDMGGKPTAYMITDVLAPGSDRATREFSREVWSALSKDDHETGAAILAYAREIDGDSEWCKNLRAVANGERVSLKNVALLASAVPSYNKHVERVIMERARLESTYQGATGERWIFPALTVTRADPRENTFSPWQEVTYLVKFMDRDGNMFVWSATRFGFKPGDVVDVLATVKEHREFRGGRETWITRATVTPAPYGPALTSRPAPAKGKSTRKAASSKNSQSRKNTAS